MREPTLVHPLAPLCVFSFQSGFNWLNCMISRSFPLHSRVQGVRTYTRFLQKTPHESEIQHDFSSLTATKRRWSKRNTDWSCWVRTYEWERRWCWWAWAMGRLKSLHRLVSLSLPPKLNLVWEYWIWEMKAFKFRQYHFFPHSNLVYWFFFWAENLLLC